MYDIKTNKIIINNNKIPLLFISALSEKCFLPSPVQYVLIGTDMTLVYVVAMNIFSIMIC